MIIKPQKKQSVWHNGAFINFTFGGAGAGLYVFLFYTGLFIPDGVINRGLLEIISLVLICCGFISLYFEAGNPVKSIYLLKNLKYSWMSREVLFGLLFVSTAVLGFFVQIELLRYIAGVSALLFLLSQGFIFYTSNAITAWNINLVPPIIILSGLLSGGGIFMLTIPPESMPQNFLLISILFLLVIHAILWGYYVFFIRDESFRNATRSLRRLKCVAPVIGAGHIMPLMVIIILTINPAIISGVYQVILQVGTGIAILFGILLQKYGLIIRASSFREIVLTPVKKLETGKLSIGV